MADEIALSAAAEEVTRALTLDGGEIRMADDDYVRFAGAFAGAQPDKEELATELLAFGIKIAREAGEAADDAVVKLGALATILLAGEVDRVVAAFDAAGIDVAAGTKRLLGVDDGGKVPLSAREKTEGAFSPMGLLLNRGKK